MIYQTMPLLSDKQFQSLKSDIASRGVLIPIEFDENNNVLDGHHRLRACQELGITDYPTVVRVGMSEQEKRDYSRSLNMNRRQLTQPQRWSIIQDQIIETPEKSNRVLASILSTDHKTIALHRRKLEEANKIPYIYKFTGSDGKTRTRKPISIFIPSEKEQHLLKILP
jgi:ParB-like chromosome segregation protein Spo0J